MAEPKKATLRDVVNYDVDSYFTEDDLAIIRSTFKGNDRLLKILRKVLLPTMADPDMPVEEMSADMWLVDKDFSGIPDHEIKPIVVARQDAIKFIAGGLIKLKILANQDNESEMEAAMRRAKDSAK